MARYGFDGAAVSDYGPYNAPAAPGGRFTWQSRARELWVLAALVGAATGIAGLVILATLAAGLRWTWRVPAIGALLLTAPALIAHLGRELRPDDAPEDDGARWPLWIPTLAGAVLAAPALPIDWPWWSPLAGGAACAGLGFAAGGLYLVRDDRRLLWALTPPAEAPLPPSPIADPFYIYCHRGPNVAARPEIDLPELPSPAERERAAYLRNLRFFVEHVYGTGDSSWRTWEHTTLPSGDHLSRGDWAEWCELLIRAGLARRPHARAPLEITSTYGDARRALRDALALPSGNGQAA